MIDYKQIKQKASDLFKKHGLTIPFSISSLASAMNIEIELCSPETIYNIAIKQDLKSLNELNPQQILGLVNKNKNIMYINNTEQAITRQRFTIAHEIGHVVLHKDIPGNNFRKMVLKKDIMNYDQDVGLEDKLEAEANYFAGYLLMPDEDIEKRLKFIELWLGGETFIRGLSNLFGVSLESMRFRLKTFKKENINSWEQYNLTSKLF